MIEITYLKQIFNFKIIENKQIAVIILYPSE